MCYNKYMPKSPENKKIIDTIISETRKIKNLKDEGVSLVLHKLKIEKVRSAIIKNKKNNEND